MELTFSTAMHVTSDRGEQRKISGFYFDVRALHMWDIFWRVQ